MHRAAQVPALGGGGDFVASQKGAIAVNHQVRHWLLCFAGDRGFLHTELTRSTTTDEADEVRRREFDAYLGGNRTCEIGLNLATGRDYESFVYTLEELTRPL
jgi:hypothetical protein